MTATILLYLCVPYILVVELLVVHSSLVCNDNGVLKYSTMMQTCSRCQSLFIVTMWDIVVALR